MHYVKQFNINGVDTKQVACIELQGKPNAATEGAIGLLGIDMLSPTHEVYKCVAVNGAIYTWELLSSGLSTISATISGNGEEVVQFPYSTLNIPNGYLVKVGDLIIDSKGYEYQVSAIDVNSCSATYCGSAFLKGDKGDPGLTPYIGENGHWWIGDTDTSVSVEKIESGSYVGVGYGTDDIIIITTVNPKLIIIQGSFLSDISQAYTKSTELAIWVAPNDYCPVISSLSVNSDITPFVFNANITSVEGMYQITLSYGNSETLRLKRQGVTYYYRIFW
jgi:hypothetical protein